MLAYVPPGEDEGYWVGGTPLGVPNYFRLNPRGDGLLVFYETPPKLFPTQHFPYGEPVLPDD